jgi:hypothetical protein
VVVVVVVMGHGLIILCVYVVCVCVCFEHAVGLVVDFLTIIWIAKVDNSTNRKKVKVSYQLTIFNFLCFLKVFFPFEKNTHTHIHIDTHKRFR